MAKEPDQDEGGKGGGGRGRGVVVLNDRFEIDPETAYKDLSTPSAQAFKAVDRRDPNRKLFALIADPNMPVRMDVLSSMKGADHASFMGLADYGPCYWPSFDRKTMVAVYRRPLGGRVTTGLAKRKKGIGEQEMVRNLIEPLIGGIRELVPVNITHRAIRLDNLFYMDEDHERIVFGDCGMAPPGFDQPAVYETIENAMCTPEGRGPGNVTDDLYALGVSIVMAFTGCPAVKDMTTEQIVDAKIEHGSYGLLVGSARLPLPMVEVLRGLLCDDPEERWDMESIDYWLNGRRLSPLQPTPDKKGKRAFHFLDKPYFTLRELAVAMSRNWQAAVEVVQTEDIETWIRRALDDKELSDSIFGAKAMVKVANSSDGQTAGDLMLTRVLCMLDQRAPLRYRGIAFNPAGLGTLIAVHMILKGDTRMITELLNRDVARHWFETRPHYNVDSSQWDARWRDMRSFYRQTAVGYGLERCLYEANDDLHCQSPLIVGEYVTDMRELLPALERVSGSVDPKAWPFDRHIAGFVSARFNQKMENYFVMVNEPAPDVSLMGMLGILATIQWRLGPETLLDLSAWIGALINPVVNSFHSRERRRNLEREVPRLIRKGNLAELFNLLEDPTERSQDRMEFEAARAEYAELQEQLDYLQSDDLGRDEQSELLGQQTAAVTSVVVGLIAFSLIIALRIW